MRFAPLLAIALSGIAALATAPAAQAGWMTGKGSLPLIGNDTVCRDGMDLQYATYSVPAGPATLDPGPIGTRPVRTPGGAQLPAPQPAPVTLRGLGVWLPDSIGPAILAPSDYTIPYQPLLLDPWPSGIDSWPAAPGELTHSASFTLSFNRILTPGTTVEVGWQHPSGAMSSFTRAVGDCWLRPPSRVRLTPVG
jgi:hypothetical protein